MADHVAHGPTALTLFKRLGACAGAIAILSAVTAAGAGGPEPPLWAYPLNPAGGPTPVVDDGVIRHVPDSALGLTRAQTVDRFTAVDWHPERHPPMPDPVAHGRKPDLFACGFCHYPNGQGRPENAALAGLATDYIVAQVAAMQDGTRKSSQPAMAAPASMLTVAAHADDDAVAIAAQYFHTLPYRPWIRVVEAAEVPRPEIHGVSAYAAAMDGSHEPIRDRIVEVPEDRSRTDLRDDASGFVAYVPPGAIDRGRTLASTAVGERQPCGVCHGADLRGGLGPPLAGRSPSYLFRQMFDMRSGARADPGAAAMKAEVVGLGAEEMRDLAAYAASLPP